MEAEQSTEEAFDQILKRTLTRYSKYGYHKIIYHGGIFAGLSLVAFLLYRIEIDHDLDVPLHYPSLVLAGAALGYMVLIYTLTKQRVETFRVLKRMAEKIEKKSEEIIKLKDEMLDITSHQLKTPLTSIEWNLELLTDSIENPNEKQKKIICELEDSSVRMKKLLQALLDIARAESGRLKVEVEKIYLEELATTVSEDLKQQLQEKNQTLNINIQNGAESINADPRFIHHALMNYISNAIKYSPENSSIEVHCQPQEDRIICSVLDSGIGVPEEDRDSLFSKFYRASNVEEESGTGLGLYLVSKIMEYTGGDAGYQPRDTGGSEFWFSIPKEGMQSKEGEITLGSK